MKIAIPTAQEQLCMHFGHCETFAILTVDTAAKEIVEIRKLTPPPHEPGVLPRWLHDQDVSLIIAGGMGMRAQQLFEQFGIEVIAGAKPDTPRAIVEAWLTETLFTGANACDH
jgi:predicted Fe-Mo cluster-binding NifX family protein